MADSIWNDLCNRPTTLKVSSEKYEQLVHDSTTQLHQSREPILSALSRRAIGLTKLTNYDAALRDAKVMQHLSPSSALGYIREADIYSEQGKQLQVIEICDKGLSMVDTMDTQYATLQRAKMDAEQRQSKRIDFISQLPTDIVTTTLVPMFVDDAPISLLEPNLYLNVSDIWRDRIVQCFGGLRFSVGHQGSQDEDIRSQVTQFAQHTKALFINRYGHRKWPADLLRDHVFCSLRQLFIDQCMNDHVDHFATSLKSISKTLTHLSVETECALPIDQIVLTCPNLVFLDLTQSRVADLSSLPMTTWPNLKRLTLNRAQEPITCDQIIGILKRFPSLNHLRLQPCSDMQSALIVSDYLPSINSLQIVAFDNDTDIEFSCHDPSSETFGITKISIEGFATNTFVDISSVLKQHQNSLEDLEWYMSGESDTRIIYDIQYPRLKKLILDQSGWWIPSNAPLLEELTLTWQAISIHPAVLDMIPPKLRKLEFMLDVGPDLVGTSAIKQYIDRIARYSHLHELVMNFYTMDNILGVVDAIHRLKQLQRLMIRVGARCDPKEMNRFVGQLSRGCPSLTCLEINCRNGLSTRSINALKQLDNLQQCSFSIDQTNANDDSIWHALETFTQLNRIRIYPAIPSNLIGVRRLKEKRPDMTIYLDQFFRCF